MERHESFTRNCSDKSPAMRKQKHVELPEEVKGILTAYFTQAGSILRLLMNDGESSDGFTSPHDDILGSLWALEDLLEEVGRKVGIET